MTLSQNSFELLENLQDYSGKWFHWNFIIFQTIFPQSTYSKLIYDFFMTFDRYRYIGLYLSNLHKSAHGIVARLTARVVHEFTFINVFTGNSVACQHKSNFARAFFNAREWCGTKLDTFGVRWTWVNCGAVCFVFTLRQAIFDTIADVFLTYAVVLTSFPWRYDFRRTRELTNIALNVAVHFVFTSFAVRLSIAIPILGNATLVFASVFIISALAIVDSNVAAVFFIFARVAILLLVTSPPQGDASTIIAFEFIGCAADWLLRAIFFIRPISTIVITIASESLQNTATAWSSHPS